MENGLQQTFALGKQFALTLKFRSGGQHGIDLKRDLQ